MALLLTGLLAWAGYAAYIRVPGSSSNPAQASGEPPTLEPSSAVGAECPPPAGQSVDAESPPRRRTVVRVAAGRRAGYNLAAMAAYPPRGKRHEEQHV